MHWWWMAREQWFSNWQKENLNFYSLNIIYLYNKGERKKERYWDLGYNHVEIATEMAKTFLSKIKAIQNSQKKSNILNYSFLKVWYGIYHEYILKRCNRQTSILYSNMWKFGSHHSRSHIKKNNWTYWKLTTQLYQRIAVTGKTNVSKTRAMGEFRPIAYHGQKGLESAPGRDHLGCNWQTVETEWGLD